MHHYNDLAIGDQMSSAAAIRTQYSNSNMPAYYPARSNTVSRLTADHDIVSSSRNIAPMGIT